MEEKIKQIPLAYRDVDELKLVVNICKIHGFEIHHGLDDENPIQPGIKVIVVDLENKTVFRTNFTCMACWSNGERRPLWCKEFVNSFYIFAIERDLESYNLLLEQIKDDKDRPYGLLVDIGESDSKNIFDIFKIERQKNYRDRFYNVLMNHAVGKPTCERLDEHVYFTDIPDKKQNKIVHEFFKEVDLDIGEDEEFNYSTRILTDIWIHKDKTIHINYFPWSGITNYYRVGNAHSYEEFKKMIQYDDTLFDVFAKIEKNND